MITIAFIIVFVVLLVQGVVNFYQNKLNKDCLKLFEIMQSEIETVQDSLWEELREGIKKDV